MNNFTRAEDDFEWLARWATKKLNNRELDAIKDMMEIAKADGGNNSSMVRTSAEKVTRLCNDYRKRRDKVTASMEIKEGLIKTAALLPVCGVPEMRLHDTLNSLQDARVRHFDACLLRDVFVMATGGASVLAFPPSSSSWKMILTAAAFAAATCFVSAIAKKTDKGKRSRNEEVLKALKYISVEAERPVLPDKFDELYADGYADVQNGKIVITASDEYLEYVADALRDNARDELGIEIGENDMTKERLQKIARAIMDRRREKLHYPRFTVTSLDGIALAQSIAAVRREKGALKMTADEKAQEKKSSRKRSGKKRKGKKSSSKEAER